jgi:putative Ca2+/H+ antiporter (TMEM165/GDT1 family)
MLLALKANKMIVFIGAFGALFIMTVLSAGFGYLIPKLISHRMSDILAALLFLIFGFKLLYEAY